VPTFLLGVVLGYLTTRCGSILPAMFFHLLYKTLLLGSALLSRGHDAWLLFGLRPEAFGVLAAGCTPVALALLWWLKRLWPHPAEVAFRASAPGLEPRFDAARQEAG